MKKNKTNKFKRKKNKTNKFKTRKYKNRKFAKGPKAEIQFYLKEYLQKHGMHEVAIVKNITKDLKDEELMNLAQDKKNYKKYKEDKENKQKELEKIRKELDKLDSQGRYKSTRGNSQRKLEREDKVEEIKRLENNMHSYIYKMQMLENKYPNFNLLN